MVMKHLNEGNMRKNRTGEAAIKIFLTKLENKLLQ